MRATSSKTGAVARNMVYFRSSYKKNGRLKAALKNPFFNKKKSRKDKKLMRPRDIFSLIIFLSVAAGWLYLFLASSFFRITRVEISGDSQELITAMREEITNIAKNKKLFFLSQNNIYFFPARKAEATIGGRLLLQEIKIEKQYPNALIVKFQTKKPVMVLLASNWKYVLDFSGEVIKRETVASSSALQKEGSGLPFLEGGADDLAISAKALPKELIDFISHIFFELPQKSGVAADIFSLVAESPSSISVKTSEGWRIILNIRTDPQEQIIKLISLLKGLTKEEREKLDYIDLRFGDRIFYKSR